jgi:hypothetical protein
MIEPIIPFARTSIIWIQDGSLAVYLSQTRLREDHDPFLVFIGPRETMRKTWVGCEINRVPEKTETRIRPSKLETRILDRFQYFQIGDPMPNVAFERVSILASASDLLFFHRISRREVGTTDSKDLHDYWPGDVVIHAIGITLILESLTEV